MKRISSIFLCLVISGTITAQTFIEKAAIEFEVKTNIKKTMGEGFWAQLMEDKVPTFKTAYFKYSFADNKSIYKLDHFNASDKLPEYLKKEDEENEWFLDHTSSTYNTKKVIAGSPFFIKDSIYKIEWKLSNENRVIAGFNCRKATGKVNDSVYVFAFYTNEITISGGPCSISGLPGMILGMAIPRLYTSWIATKVNIAEVDETVIKPTISKKTMSRKEYKSFIIDRSKDWGGDSEEGKGWANQFIWSSLL